jgi:hypothetical protein
MGSKKSEKEKLTRERLQRVLCQAAAKDNSYIINFFFSSLRETGNSGIIKKLLLHTDECGNAWFVAARSDHIKVLEKP